MKDFSNIFYILTTVVISVIGQVFIKKGLDLTGKIDLSSGVVSGYLRIFQNPLTLLGSFIYLAATLFWLYILSKVDLSFAYPFLALSYVLIIIASRLFLGESISSMRWAGVIVICLGVFLISKS